MDYFKLIKQINPGKTAIIEDGKPYTYGNLVEMAVIKATEIKNCCDNMNNFIKERSLRKDENLPLTARIFYTIIALAQGICHQIA